MSKPEKKHSSDVLGAYEHAARIAKTSNFVDGPEGTVEGQIARAILAAGRAEVDGVEKCRHEGVNHYGTMGGCTKGGKSLLTIARDEHER